MNNNTLTHSFETAYQTANDPYCICFNDKISSRKALPYSQMLGGELAQDTNTMTISFTSMTVLIEGVNLLQIFTPLINRKLSAISIGSNGELKVTNISYSMISANGN